MLTKAWLGLLEIAPDEERDSVATVRKGFRCDNVEDRRLAVVVLHLSFSTVYGIGAEI